MPTATCAGFSDATIAKMAKAMHHAVPGPKRGGVPGPPVDDSTLWNFNYACVDQEAIVIYDPKVLADAIGRRPDQRPAHIPKLDFSADACAQSPTLLPRVWPTLLPRVWPTLLPRVWPTLLPRVWPTLLRRVWLSRFRRTSRSSLGMQTTSGRPRSSRLTIS